MDTSNIYKTGKNQYEDGYYIPNYYFERKTQAFNLYLGFPVYIISLFIVVFGVIIPCVFIMSFLDLESIFLWEYSNYLFVVFVVGGAIVAVKKGISLLSSMKTSYKIEGNKLIRGMNSNEGDISDEEMAIQAACLRTMFKNMGKNSTMFNLAYSISNFISIFKMIMLNYNYDYVERFFDTDCYKKKEFTNPVLVKETKYCLIFKTDTRKVKIPKIYPGISKEPNVKGKSISRRIIKRIIVVLLIAIIFSLTDISYNFYKNPTYKESISNTWEELSDGLLDYEFSPHETRKHVFARSVGERYSEVKYYLDKDGQIIDVDINIYYPTQSGDKEDEIRYIISTVNHNFNENEISEFVEALNQSVEEGFTYYKLNSTDGKYTLLISLSSGDIHVKGMDK